MLLHDFDPTMKKKNLKEAYTQAGWNDEHFKKFKSFFELGFKEHKNFFKDHDYSWITDKNSYSFIIEPFAQAIALDTVVENWANDKKYNQQYENICVRQSASWNILNSTPRTLNPYIIRWIIVPYIWDEALGLIFSGLLKCINIEKISINGAITHTIEDKTFTKAHTFWDALIARSIAGNIKDAGKQYILPKHIQDIEKKLSAINALKITQDVNNEMLALFRSLALAFSIAHEVGHILTDKKYDKVSQELNADTLALAGLYHCNNSLMGISNKPIDRQTYTVMSGLMFLTATSIIHNLIAQTETSPFIKDNLQASKKLTEARINFYTVNATKILHAQNSSKTVYYSFHSLRATLTEYAASFFSYIETHKNKLSTPHHP